MKKPLFIYFSLISCAVICLFLLGRSDESRIPRYEVTYNADKTFKKIKKEERIEGRFIQEFELTKDPATGKIPGHALSKARKITQRRLREAQLRSGIPGVVWEERGPNNIGGRTRALMFDPNDNTHKKVFAGSVAGGLWVTEDITASPPVWNVINDFWGNLAIGSICYSPGNTQHMYVGTGEGYGNLDAVRGKGIWKSIDGGITWDSLANTTSWTYVKRLRAWGNDNVIAATNNGLRITNDGGTNWTTAISGNFWDVEIAANGDMYASTHSGSTYTIYKSTDNGVSWSTTLGPESGRRSEIAIAPSNSNYVYVLTREASGNNVEHIKVSTNGGITWNTTAIPSYLNQNCTTSTTEFTRGQAWYNLTIHVDPTNENSLIVGGIDLHRSEDNGTTWSPISYWTGGCDAYVHADIHEIISRPGYDDAILVGSDGGVSYSTNAFTTGSNPSFTTKNHGYNVTQFYAGAIHPVTAADYYLVGSQDNGTKKLTNIGVGIGGNITGGDGAFCHIDQDEPDNQISSYVYNNFYISNDGFSTLQSLSTEGGSFINPTDYDDLKNILYARRYSGSYARVKGIGGSPYIETVDFSFGGSVTHVRVSPNVDDRVYFGVANVGIYQIDDADTDSPAGTLITLPTMHSFSSIDIEYGNEDHMLVTYSNYGVTSVYETVDGGASWTAVEGDLPNMPVRWGMFNPNDANQALLATELGVWSTDDLDGGSTHWDPTNASLANTRVDMLQYRRSDFQILAATHGRGAFTTNSLACGNPGDCYGDIVCRIQDVTTDNIVCDEVSNTHSVDITVTIKDTPSSGMLVINGEQFAFGYDQQDYINTYTLTEQPNTDSAIDIEVSFTDEGCAVQRIALYVSPADNCELDNFQCSNAKNIMGSGTCTTNGPLTGNGCYNCSNASHADWWKFTPECTGDITIQSCGYGVDTRVWVYSGSCEALVPVGNNDDACDLTNAASSDWASEVLDIPVEAGVTYYLEWDNRWSTSGFDFDFTYDNYCDCILSTDKIYVDPTAMGVQTGCSWEDAFINIQSALDALEDHDNITEIWIKEGTYYPTDDNDRTKTILLTEAVNIYGGFDGTETSLSQRDVNAHATIFSGDIGVPIANADNSYHVVTVSDDVVGSVLIDGVTIRDGHANGLTIDQDKGAGILTYSGMILDHVEISNCISSASGGGIALQTGAVLTCKDITLTNIISGGSGSIIYIGTGAELVIDGTTTF